LSYQFFDLTGSITYFSCTIISLLIGARTADSTFSFSTRAIIQSLFTLVWAARLGSFLFKRISKDSKDKVSMAQTGRTCNQTFPPSLRTTLTPSPSPSYTQRFDQIKINPPRFFGVWTIQGAWVTLTAISVFVVNSYGATDDKPINAVDILGYLIWVIGFGIEVTADNQKSKFAANPDNKGKVRTGRK
jgi:steroid 5-alpha reductase family enzyme